MFERSVELLNHSRYLGNYRVVDGLVRDFVAQVMDAAAEEDISRAAASMANVFAAVDPSYVQVDGWATSTGLGRHLDELLDVDSSQPFYDMVRTAFLIFAQQLMEAVIDGGGEDVMQARVDALIKRHVGILMGAGPMVAK